MAPKLEPRSRPWRRSSFISRDDRSKTMWREKTNEPIVTPGSTHSAGRRNLVGNPRLAGIRRAQSVSGPTLLAPGTRVPDLQRSVGDECALHRRGADAGRRNLG